jgi:putative cell wall-binding protein
LSIRTKRSSKRLIAAAVAVAVTASTFAISSTAGAAGTADPSAARLGGANRFATAAEIAASINTSTNTVTEAIIVNARNFPDGLAASVLAQNGGTFRPILLTEATELPAETIASLKDLKNLTKVWIMGGTSAVATSVLGQVVDAVPGVNVERLAGADRYETAIKIAETVSTAAAPTTVILATGENFPDALTAGALAAQEGYPILLNNGSTLRADVEAFLTGNLAVKEVIIVGGTAVVPAAVETAIKALKNGSGDAIATFRHGGANRYETAVSLTASISAAPNGISPASGVILANGLNFPDALAAGPLSAKVGAPILLTLAGSIPAATAAWHVANANSLVNVWAVGGTSVVSAEVLAGAKAAASAQAPTLTLASLTTTATASAMVNIGSNNVTVSALATGVAKGAYGNDWTVSVSATAATGLAPVITVSTSASPCASCTDAISTANAVIIAVPAGGITAANLKTAFDASAAAEIFSMAVEVGSTVITASAANGGVLTGGETEVKLALTFSQNVDNGTGNVVVAASSAFNAAVLLDTAATAFSTTNAVASFTVAAQLTDGAVLAAWTTGTAEVRLAAGVFVTSAPLGNAVTTKVLTLS